MAYQIETIKQSQKIFYYLLEHHELREEKAPELHKAYIEQDEVQTLVKSQADAADSHVETYGGIIYLIPGQENNYLGYSKGQLKKELCRSNATDKDYYLVQFVILVLLLEFYDGQGSSSKTRDFILLGDLQNSITDKLKEGARVIRRMSRRRMAWPLLLCERLMSPCVLMKKEIVRKPLKKVLCSAFYIFCRSRV